MPPLDNSRHERFAQELAKGLAKGDAYVAAGYDDSPASATRLSKNVKISQRVDELKAKAAERCEVTIADLTKRLMRLAEKGEQLSDAPGFSVARAATMDIAKLNGLVVEKKELAGANGGPIQVSKIVHEVIDPTDAG